LVKTVQTRVKKVKKFLHCRPQLLQPGRAGRVYADVMAAACQVSTLPDIDAQLMVRVREGDRAGFELLMLRHREPVVHFLYRMVQNQDVAEELAQEVFLRVYRSRAGYQPTARFTSWLYRIAANLAFNWLRHQRRENNPLSLDAARRNGVIPQIADQQASVEELLIRRTMLDGVRRAVAALPDRQRAVVLLHKYHGMDYEQIAQTLGCSVQAVKSLTFRAYANLRRSLAQGRTELSGAA